MAANKRPGIVVAGLVLIAFVSSDGVFAEEKKARENHLYRYRNHEGVLVMDDRVPPEFAGAGYEVLNASGRVIETVPPAAPAAPVSRESAADAVSHAVSEREDKFLLASYSTVADINAAKQRKLTSFQREIDIAKANLDRTRQRRAKLREQAGELQRSGREVPAAVASSLDGLGAEEKSGEDLVRQREQEYRDTERLYDGYAARFQVLKASPPPAVPAGAAEAPSETSEDGAAEDPAE